MIRRRNINQDVMAGLVFIVFGTFFLYFGREYTVGTALRMGPGYLPNVIGWGLLIVGAGLGIRGALLPGDELAGLDLRPLIFVCGAFLVFSQLIGILGLPVTAVATMLCAAIGGPSFRLREQIILSLFAAVAATLLFIEGLGLPMKIWPVWLDPVFYG